MQFINSTLSVDSLSELVSFCKLSKFSFLVKDISALRGQTLEIKKNQGNRDLVHFCLSVHQKRFMDRHSCVFHAFEILRAYYISAILFFILVT